MSGLTGRQVPPGAGSTGSDLSTPGTAPKDTTHGAYRLLASIYDAWQEGYGVFSRQVLGKLLPYFDRQFPSPQRFADLGCGTGTLLLALAGRFPHWTFLGLDGSGPMLEQARRKSATLASHARISWTEAPLTAPMPQGPYGAVGSFFNTLNHLPDEESLEKAFHAVAEALAPSGRFFFDTNNERGFLAWWRSRRLYRGDGWTLDIAGDFDPHRGKAFAHLTIHRGEEHSQAVVEETHFSDAQIVAALKRARLRVEECAPWSPFPGDLPGATWWVARKSP